MNWPDLTVLLVTYYRPAEIRKTILALQKHIRYAGRVKWHLADDGSPEGYVDDIIRDFESLSWTFSITPRLGWGSNVNEALGRIGTDYIFLCEDDYVAKRPLNLMHGVGLLEACPDLGLVRYDGISGHVGLRLELKEAQILSGRRIDYMEINLRTSGHLNVYSNRPHLRHWRFHKTVGMYPEGQPLGLTEEAYAHKVRDADPSSGIAILEDGVPRAFDHIGKSRQGTDLDPNRRRG